MTDLALIWKPQDFSADIAIDAGALLLDYTPSDPVPDAGLLAYEFTI
jgi:hypothetical protein